MHLQQFFISPTVKDEGSSENFTLIMEVYKGVGEFSNNWTTMLCTMVIVLVPITIFYIIMQKHIIAGITSGAVKG